MSSECPDPMLISMTRTYAEVGAARRTLLELPVVERYVRVADVNRIRRPVDIVDVHRVAAGRPRRVEHARIARAHELHPADEVLRWLVVAPVGPPLTVEVEPPVAVVPHAIPGNPLLVEQHPVELVVVRAVERRERTPLRREPSEHPACAVPFRIDVTHRRGEE